MAMLEKVLPGKGDKHTHAISSASEKKEIREQEKDMKYILKTKAIRKTSSRK